MAARAINDAGVVAGWGTNNGETEGFILSGGAYQFVVDPNAAGSTFLEGLNNHGIAVGEWDDALGNSHAFEYDTHTGVFTEITVPGAINVDAFGINDKGFVVLTTDIATGPNNFLYGPASVPEPATWAMMLLGVFGAGAMLRRRRAGALAA